MSGGKPVQGRKDLDMFVGQEEELMKKERLKLLKRMWMTAARQGRRRREQNGGHRGQAVRSSMLAVARVSGFGA